MSKRKGCIKIGCMGCGGIAGLFLLMMIVFGVGAAMQSGEGVHEQRELAQVVPTVVLPDDPSQATTDGIEQPLFRFDDIETPDAGTIHLNLSKGSFIVEPGPAGEPIRVEGDFDTSRFKLVQEYTPASGGEGWVYKVRFNTKGFFSMFGVQNSRGPNVRIIIPRDAPFALKGNVSMGESDIELGGLWVTDVDLETGMGEHRVGFDDPVMTPIEGFKVDGSMGALQIAKLGNASPKSASVRLSMGELRLNLRGPWAQDADIEVRSSMGECDITLDNDVNVDIQRASIGLGERNIRAARDREEIPGAPTVRLNASHSMGELRIR